MSMNPVEVSTDDGQTLAAIWHDAQEPTVGLTVIIAGELGYNQTHYAPYAMHLCEMGMDVLTFDYRSTGESTAELKNAAPRLIDCGRLDLAAMIEWARQTKPSNPVVMVGHGVGGVLAGLATNNHRLSALLSVAASTGYLRKWPMWLRPLSWIVLRLIVPFKSRFRERGILREFGPEELPASILRDWAEWCTHPNAPVDTFGVPQHRYFEAWKKPIRCYSFTDDGLAPARAVHTLAARYVNAPQELITCTPESLGIESIGHDGFFHGDIAGRLWDESAEWLLKFVTKSEQTNILEL